MIDSKVSTCTTTAKDSNRTTRDSYTCLSKSVVSISIFLFQIIRKCNHVSSANADAKNRWESFSPYIRRHVDNHPLFSHIFLGAGFSTYAPPADPIFNTDVLLAMLVLPFPMG